MKKIIPLVFILTSCGLYVDNSYDYTYNQLLAFGLEEMNYSEPAPLIVLGEGGRITSYRTEGEPDNTMILKEIVSYKGVNIESYHSTLNSSILLLPLE